MLVYLKHCKEKLHTEAFEWSERVAKICIFVLPCNVLLSNCSFIERGSLKSSKLKDSPSRQFFRQLALDSKQHRKKILRVSVFRKVKAWVGFFSLSLGANFIHDYVNAMWMALLIPFSRFNATSIRCLQIIKTPCCWPLFSSWFCLPDSRIQ